MKKAFNCLEGAKGRSLYNLHFMQMEYSAALIDLGHTSKAIITLDKLIKFFESKSSIAQRNLAVSNAHMASALVKENKMKEAWPHMKNSIGILRQWLSSDDSTLMRAESTLKILNQEGFTL